MNKAAAAAALLALLTGFVLGQFQTLGVPPGSPSLAAPNPSPRALAAAHAFYDGLNRLLATGDRAIESTVTPDFIDHTLSGQGERTLPEMIDWLLAMRATWPHLRVTVLELEQEDHLIAARLEVDSGAPSQTPGIPLAPLAPGEVLEFLRVEGAGVTDHWEASVRLPVATLRGDSLITWNSRSLVMPAIEQLSLDPGHSAQLPLAGTLILLVESGSVQLDHAGTDLEGSLHPRQELLEAGHARVLTGSDPIELRNVSGDPAELLAFTANGGSAPKPAPGDATTNPAGQRMLAFMPLQRSSDLRGPYRISIVRLTLPPGSTVASHSPGLLQEIAVLDGSIDVTVGQGRALVCSDGATAHPFVGTETIATGEGVSAKGSTAVGYRVTSPYPATVLVVTISPLPGSPQSAPGQS